jgi:hypothetical protein
MQNKSQKINKIKLLTFVLGLIILISSCENRPSTKSEKGPQKLFDSVNYSFEDERKDSNSYFKMNYALLDIIGFDKLINDSINTDLRSFVFEVEPNLPIPLKQLVQESKTSLLNEYQIQLKDFPENYNGYDHDIKQRFILQNENFISFEVERYSFSAGAHGMGWMDFIHHDLKTGKRLYLNDFFKSTDKLMILAESSFRKQMELKENDDLEKNGFWFTNNKFHFNENFCFRNDSIEFIYNQYEIAPFSMGPILIKVPAKEVKSDLTEAIFN